MKRKSPSLTPKWDELFPLLITRFRKLMKLPIGPTDRLQTREFQTLIENLLSYRASQDLSSVESLGAYLMYDFALHYAEGLSLLKELPKAPRRVLEIGAKGAAFCLAALQHGAEEAVALDPETKALTYGADVCGHLGYPISIRTWDPSNLGPLPVDGKWDLIVLPYTLFRFFDSEETQASFIKRLLPLLSEEGHLLLVESSQPESNRKFLLLRDHLARLLVPIVAPCLWKKECPALKHGSVCFAQRELENKPFMIKEIQRSAKINQNSLKMSYLLIGSPNSPSRTLPDNLYRVVSPPVRTARGERFFLCGVVGQKTLGTTLPEPPSSCKAFSYLKRGDVISIDKATELDGDLQIISSTSLRLVAPCDKPVIKETHSS
jgi:hypothetical protein